MSVKIYDSTIGAFKDAETPLIWDEQNQAYKDSTGLVWNESAQAWEERWGGKVIMNDGLTYKDFNKNIAIQLPNITSDMTYEITAMFCSKPTTSFNIPIFYCNNKSNNYGHSFDFNNDFGKCRYYYPTSATGFDYANLITLNAYTKYSIILSKNGLTVKNGSSIITTYSVNVYSIPISNIGIYLRKGSVDEVFYSLVIRNLDNSILYDIVPMIINGKHLLYDKLHDEVVTTLD